MRCRCTRPLADVGKVKVLFGVRKGNEDWQEELITEVEERIPAAMAWAKKNGFDRLRIAEVDLSVPPDFTTAVNRNASR